MYTRLILQGVYAILSFHSLTLGITLGCAAVSSLEAGPLVLERVGSETGAATFLDLKIQKHKSFFSRSSESNFSCSYFTCPQLPARERNWSSTRNRDPSHPLTGSGLIVGNAHFTISQNVYLPPCIGLTKWERMVSSFASSQARLRCQNIKSVSVLQHHMIKGGFNHKGSSITPQLDTSMSKTQGFIMCAVRYNKN